MVGLGGLGLFAWLRLPGFTEMTVGVTRYITNLLMNLTKHNKKMKP